MNEKKATSPLGTQIETLKTMIVDYCVLGASGANICDILYAMTAILDEMAAQLEVPINP